MTILQGLINGGTACYLADNAHEDYSSHKLPDKTVWKILTFELNHLTLLATEIIRQVGIGSNVLNPFASALFFITPITLLFDFLTRESPLSQRQHSFCKGINQFYMITTIISSIAFLYLGNVGCAISSLAFITINALVHVNFNNSTCKKIVSWVNTSCAALAFVGYGAWVISCGSLFAKINFAVIAIELIVFKIWNFCSQNTFFKSTGSNSARSETCCYQYPPYQPVILPPIYYPRLQPDPSAPSFMPNLTGLSFCPAFCNGQG